MQQTYEFVEVFGGNHVGALAILFDLGVSFVVIEIKEVVGNTFKIVGALLQHRI